MTRFPSPKRLFLLTLAGVCCAQVLAQEAPPGRDVDSLLIVARERNPEYAGMRHEAAAAGERVVPAGALADPRLRIELRDLTRMGEQKATFSPSRVGSTKYLLMQDLPWYGKRDLKRQIAELDAQGAEGRAMGNWSDLAARIKSAHAQLFSVQRNQRLTREILDLMLRLEGITRLRYTQGLAAQSDVIRAQVEQTSLMNELLGLDNDRRQLQARINALLARPATATLAEPDHLRPLPAPTLLDYAVLEERVRTRNPQLFAEAARIGAAEKSRELAYRNRYPDFIVGLAPIQYQGSIDEWEFMVEINIPLQQASRRAQERESEAMLSATRARRDATASQVLGELAENLSAIEAARQSEKLAQSRLLPQAELGFQSALAAYENGRIDFITLLEAQRQIRQARQSQLKAQVEAQVRLAEVERLLGEDL
jgi:cobalt-zinc-cadmium efflux system outer membrane protein